MYKVKTAIYKLFKLFGFRVISNSVDSHGQLKINNFKNNTLQQIPLPVDFESSITLLEIHPNHPSKVLITTASRNFIEVEIP